MICFEQSHYTFSESKQDGVPARICVKLLVEQTIDPSTSVTGTANVTIIPISAQGDS